MDGFQLSIPSCAGLVCQHTLKSSIGCVGVGLHSGQKVRMTLRPAGSGTGMVFRRTDLGLEIPARFNRVCHSQLSTSVGDDHGRVGTVEHVLAALAGTGVDNAVIELDGPEVPILDGSASPFVFLLDCAGIQPQDVPRPMIEIVRAVRVESDSGFVELRPGPGFPGLEMALSIEFSAVAIGRQSISMWLTPENFRHELCRSRTFALAQEVAALQAAGFGKGGSLDNALIVDESRVLNPGGLRMDREFARHKLLDAVGDLALAGAPIQGRFVAHRSGHALNNRLLRALFADPSAWRWAEAGHLSAAA